MVQINLWRLQFFYGHLVNAFTCMIQKRDSVMWYSEFSNLRNRQKWIYWYTNAFPKVKKKLHKTKSENISKINWLGIKMYIKLFRANHDFYYFCKQDIISQKLSQYTYFTFLQMWKYRCTSTLIKIY